MSNSLTTPKATSPAVAIDCSEWIDTSGWTVGEFQQKKSTSPAVLVDFSEPVAALMPSEAEITQLCERLKAIKSIPALQQLKAVIDLELQAQAS